MWGEILTQIIDSLQKVGIGILIFILMYLANMFAGIWYNTKIIGHKFSWKRIRNSLIKVIFTGLAVVFLCVGITMVVPWVNYAGLPLPEEFNEVITVLAMCGIALTGIVRYGKESLEKLNKIFNSETGTKESSK